VRSRFRPWLPVVLAIVLLLGAGFAIPVRATSPLEDAAAATLLIPPSPPPAPATAPATGPVEVAPAYLPAAGVTPLGPTPTAPMDVAVGLPSRDPSGLAAFVAASEVPGTSSYHRFLTASQAEDQFGAPASEVAAARSYFAAYGLATSVNPDGLLLFVTGSAGSIGAAFGTTFDEYRTSAGAYLLGHPTPAVLPASLGTDGVFGLGNVTPLAPAVAPSTAASIAPDTSCSGPSGGLSPCAVAQAYDIAPLEANGTNGSGTRIGVVDAYSAAEGQTQLASDLATFANDSGLPVGNVSYFYPVPTDLDLNASGTNSGWSLEDALDLEWARASAPGATIDMTFSPNPDAGLYDAIDWLVANDAVNVVTMSWGEPDTGVFNAFSGPCTAACNASTDGSYEILGPVLELGAAEGISFFAASGDCGASDGTSGVATNFPASDPYVTGVGGTVLVLGTNDSYESESAWSGNATGTTSPGCTNQGGSGGGFAPFPEPWWQSGISDPSGQRGVPDVSMDAANPVAVVVGGSSEGVIGTSVGTPVWAGIAAIADQYAGGDLGLLNPSLYDILRGPSYSADFHDIVQGSNGYSAGPGWDPVTGIGTPIVGALVPELVRGGGLAGGALSASVYASPRSGHAPLTVSFALTAAGGSGAYPLEGVSFGDGGSAVWNGTVLTHTYAVDGVYLAQAFVADSAGNTSTSLPVLIAVGGSAISVALNVTPTTPAVGAPVTMTAVATGGTAPYNYTFYFGDGSFTAPGAATAGHDYAVAGSFCAEVVAVDSASPAGAAASARVPVTVGGGAPADCNTESTPLTVTASDPIPVLDAPADYGTSLFTVSGGATGPGGLSPTTSLASNDSYIAACGCEIFRTAGNYSVTEWANDSVDGSAEATANVTVAPPLAATFAASTLSGFAPLKVYYFSSVKGGNGANANLTRWTFGNGESAVGHSVTTTYTAPGEYLAIGQLSDLGRGNGSEAFLVDVQPPATVPLGFDGTISPAVNVSSGASVRFTGSIVGTPGETANTQLLWNLGDGHTAFGPTATETFTAPLVGSSNDTLTGEVTIETSYLYSVYTTGFHLTPFFALESGGYTPRTDVLVAQDNITPIQNLVPFPIFGNASASGPHPISLVWNFDDGSTATGTSIQHQLYASQGYTIRVEFTDAFGDTADILTAISANGPLGIAGGPSPPSGPKPLSVTIATAAYGGKGPPYRYEWTLLNGTHPTTSSVSLYLPQVGKYVVHLNVTDRAGEVDERNFTIVVGYPNPDAPAEIVLGSAGIGALVAFVLGRQRTPRPPKPGEVPWIDHPRTASDGTPVW
jgi:hypothetical protein